MNKTLFLGIFTALLLAGCNAPVEESSKEDLTEGVFINEVPKDDFASLRLEDFPDYREGYSYSLAIGEDAVYLVSDPYLLKYDFEGNVVAYANPKILPCGVEVAKVGDKLFVACRQEGVYEIDLTKNEIVYNYTHEDGLKEYQNPNFAVQGKNLWMGTFDGIAKIDTETRKLSFYDEKSFPGSNLNSNVYVNGDQVWATVAANAYNGGSAGYYNSDDDAWTTFGVEDFSIGNLDINRVDFERFVVSGEGVFASYRYGGPENTVLTKFDATSQKWIQVYAAGWDEFGNNVESYLPARETYKDYEIAYSYEEPVAKFKIYKDGVWKKIGEVPTYVALSPLINDSYYLLGKTGIYSFSKEDSFPKLVAGEDFPGGLAKMFASEDDKYLVALSANVNEMGGDLNSYAVQVLNLETKEYYMLEIDGDGVAQEDIFQISEKIEMEQVGQKMFILLTSGKKLTLDLEAKTFGVPYYIWL